ncbi:hypothetical protein JYT26_00530 [Beggiatoa alba]|nr:hypothetical protein [Beggiatoa alba]
MPYLKIQTNQVLNADSQQALMQKASALVSKQLVLFQCDIAGFSWSVSVQGKARLAANGHSPSQEAERSHER